MTPRLRLQRGQLGSSSHSTHNWLTSNSHLDYNQLTAKSHSAHNWLTLNSQLAQIHLTFSSYFTPTSYSAHTQPRVTQALTEIYLLHSWGYVLS